MQDQLYKDLFADYNPAVIPLMEDYKTGLEVKFGMSLQQILKVVSIFAVRDNPIAAFDSRVPAGRVSPDFAPSLSQGRSGATSPPASRTREWNAPISQSEIKLGQTKCDSGKGTLRTLFKR